MHPLIFFIGFTWFLYPVFPLIFYKKIKRNIDELDRTPVRYYEMCLSTSGNYRLQAGMFAYGALLFPLFLWGMNINIFSGDARSMLLVTLLGFGFFVGVLSLISYEYFLHKLKVEYEPNYNDDKQGIIGQLRKTLHLMFYIWLFLMAMPLLVLGVLTQSISAIIGIIAAFMLMLDIYVIYCFFKYR